MFPQQRFDVFEEMCEVCFSAGSGRFVGLQRPQRERGEAEEEDGDWGKC